jgi:hypothetical protein
MKPGDIVKQKGENNYGLVEYSTFGISIHCLIEYEGNLGLSKTLVDKPSRYEQYWEVVDKLPKHWEIGPYGCPIKK